MIGLKEGECLESAIALYSVVSSGDESSTARECSTKLSVLPTSGWKESTQNISDHLVTISCFDHRVSTEDEQLHTTGTGLQLTSNGFILTAYHTITDVLEEWERILDEEPLTQENLVPWIKEFQKKYYVLDAKGTRYPIDPTFFAYNENFDTAIIKAVMPCESVEATRFKILVDGLQPKDEIMLMGHKWGREFNQLGCVTKLTKTLKLKGRPIPVRDAFYTDAYSIGGFSGGVYVTLEGELAGLHIAGSKIDTDKELSYARGVQIVNILQVILEAATSVKNLADDLEARLES